MDHGDHACVIYSEGSELIAVVASFLSQGLRERERCWYAASSPSELFDLRLALQARDVAVTPAEECGSLRLVTSAEVYLDDGTFDPDRVLQELRDAIPAAVHDGFTGLRVAGEMSWALATKPGTDRLIEYEKEAERMLRCANAVAVCLYHRRRTPAALLDGALASHPLAGVGELPRPNAFYRPKAIADLRVPQPDDVCWKLKHLQRNRH